MSDLLVELRIESPGACPVAAASDDGGDVVEVSRSTVPDDDGRVAEVFVARNGEPSAPDVSTVFEGETHGVYRFERAAGAGCVCECVEGYGVVVSEVRANAGSLFVSFYAPDVEIVREIVGGLEDTFGDVSVRSMATADGPGSEFVFVDRGTLTARQREVLETAHEMGYFDHPKGANAGEVAEALGVAGSTFTEHLAAAQRKLLADVL